MNYVKHWMVEPNVLVIRNDGMLLSNAKLPKNSGVYVKLQQGDATFSSYLTKKVL